MAEAFLQLVVNKLSSLIEEEIGLMMGVEEEMKKVCSTLAAIQSVVEDAEHKQIESGPIRDWLRKLNLLTYQIDDILDDCNIHVSRHRRYSLNKILHRHKIARRLRKVTEYVDSVVQERNKFHLREMPGEAAAAAAARETGSLLNEPGKVYGREKDRDKIVQILVDRVSEKQRISVLPIVGVGGLGKTTLAQLVFNDHRVVNHFEIRIWVCVFDSFEIMSLVKAMIESATGSGRASDLQHLDAPERCLSDLLSRKRYLIVLDDVWNEQQERWFELKDIISCGSTGSSVMVTTRQKKVADIMGTLPPHCLKGLSDDHCWMLLKQRAFRPEEEVEDDEEVDYLELERIGKQIVRKCVGVPLAANALGGILRFKRKAEEWLYVRDSEIWKLSAEDSLIMPALSLSYHHLPLELRQCFAYLAAFPRDCQIEKEELILLWMAHGFISSKGVLQMEEVGNEICNELVLRSLLQPTASNWLCVHGLVHDLAQSVMENKVPGIQSEGNMTTESTIRQVNLVERNVMFPKTFEQDLDIYSIMELGSLRVLDASFAGIKQLPHSIGNLKHLRYLNLSRSEIHTLPNSLCTLWNLQTINLDFCLRLAGLPKNIRYLHNLRHLCLRNCESLSQMPPRMRELSHLRTLSMFVVGFNRGNRLEELQCLNLGGRLEIRHLERVKDHMDAKKANLCEKKDLKEVSLSWERNNLSELDNDIDEKVLEELEPHPNLEQLCISGFNGRCFPPWMKCSSLGKVVEIHIKDCRNCRHLPKLGELHHLKRLRLENVGVVYIIEDEIHSGTQVRTLFMALEHLYLLDLPSLRRISKEQESREAFLNLKELCIKQCTSLTPPQLSSLTKLENLTCTSSALASLPSQNSLTTLAIEENTTTCFPVEVLEKLSNLRSLTISGAREISSRGQGLRALKRLEHLTMEDCKIMRDGLIRNLTSLRSLCIVSCPELAELPEEIEHLQNLESLVLYNLPKMARLPESICRLSSLRKLFLGRLAEVETVPERLEQLESLSVEECPKIVSIPAPVLNLKFLSVEKCPELERRCERGSGEEWHKIAHIPRLRIG